MTLSLFNKNSVFYRLKPRLPLSWSSRCMLLKYYFESDIGLFVTLESFNIMIFYLFYHEFIIFDSLNRKEILIKLKYCFSKFKNYYNNVTLIKNDIKEAEVYFNQEFITALNLIPMNFSEQNKVLYSMYQNQDLLLSHESKNIILEKVIKLENECENLIKKKLKVSKLRLELYDVASMMLQSIYDENNGKNADWYLYL